MVLEIEDIKKIIPHRYPMLMIDRIIEMTPDKIVAIKNVTGNEQIFQGHFPDRPIMPGVLIVEAMAQVGGVAMITERNLKDTDAHVYFMSLDNVKFRKMVVPGDQLRLEITPLVRKKKISKMHAEAFVDGTLVAEADFMATVG